jgi:hypothetical protein
MESPATVAEGGKEVVFVPMSVGRVGGIGVEVLVLDCEIPGEQVSDARVDVKRLRHPGSAAASSEWIEAYRRWVGAR